MWVDRGLSLATAVVVVATLYSLVRERTARQRAGQAPSEQPVVLREGDRLPDSPALELFTPSDVPGEVDRVRIPDGRPVLLLVFSSTCPACYANLPAWRRVIGASGRTTVMAVGLEPDQREARAYATKYLPGAGVWTSSEPRSFASALGVNVVPFTALLDRDGIVRFMRRGGLDSAAVSSLRQRLLTLEDNTVTDSKRKDGL